MYLLFAQDWQGTQKEMRFLDGFKKIYAIYEASIRNKGNSPNYTKYLAHRSIMYEKLSFAVFVVSYLWKEKENFSNFSFWKRVAQCFFINLMRTAFLSMNRKLTQIENSIQFSITNLFENWNWRKTFQLI